MELAITARYMFQKTPARLETSTLRTEGKHE
jgi:hypothetical protein